MPTFEIVRVRISARPPSGSGMLRIETWRDTGAYESRVFTVDAGYALADSLATMYPDASIHWSL